MNKVLLISFCILLLFPTSSSFSQKTDVPPTLSVVLSKTSPFVYTDSEGYTVVVGEVENNGDRLSITNIQIRVDFYDETSFQPLSSMTGGTVLEVIPPKSKSPYVIRSATPDAKITAADVTLIRFEPATTKPQGLQVDVLDVINSGTLSLSGTVKNSGKAPTTNINIFIAFYDSFQPPRIIDVANIQVDSLAINQEKQILFDQSISPRASKFLLFAESDIFTSNLVEIKIPEPQILTKQVMISDVYVSDITGKPISELKVGQKVNIQVKSWIQMLTESKETPYKFYAQVKQSGETPFVEFLGHTDGKFIGTEREFPSVSWIPKNPGVFFIESYVWNGIDIPMADPGPVVLVIVK